jgi:hypothetical protein
MGSRAQKSTHPAGGYVIQKVERALVARILLGSAIADPPEALLDVERFGFAPRS